MGMWTRRRARGTGVGRNARARVKWSNRLREERRTEGRKTQGPPADLGHVARVHRPQQGLVHVGGHKHLEEGDGGPSWGLGGGRRRRRSRGSGRRSRSGAGGRGRGRHGAGAGEGDPRPLLPSSQPDGPLIESGAMSGRAVADEGCRDALPIRPGVKKPSRGERRLQRGCPRRGLGYPGGRHGSLRH